MVNGTKKFSDLTAGFVLIGLSLILFIAAFVIGRSAESRNMSMILQFVALLLGITVWVYLLVKIHRLHKALEIVTNGGYPITPFRAVAYQFIPFFNLYWMFRWPNEVAHFVNAVKNAPAMKMNIAGLFFLVSNLLARAATPIGDLIALSVFNGIAKNVEQAVGEPAAASYSKERYKANRAWLWFCGVVGGLVILGLLLSIAIPNFMQAVDRARERAAQEQSAQGAGS